MVLHPPKDVVVDVAEEMYFWFHAPIIANIFQGGVFVEHAAVPAAHLVVGYERAVLDVLFFEHLCGLVEQVTVDPVGHCPMLLGNDL